MKMIHFPKTRLSELAARPGGIAREIAIEGAMEHLESVREESKGVMESTIVSIEAITLAARKTGKVSKAQMQELLQHGDQLVTLAGLFGYTSLGIVTRSLCDVTDGLLQADVGEVAPILVHAQAIRMMSPGAKALAPEEVEKILAELKKVLAHFDISPFSDALGIQEIEEV